MSGGARGWGGVMGFVLVAVVGCHSWDHTDAGDGSCKLKIEPGVAVQFRDGGIFQGNTREMFVYSDGRVVIKQEAKGTREIKITTDEVATLLSDVKGTGALDEDEGCYGKESNDEDGAAPRFFAIRAEDGHTAAYSVGDGPDELQSALDRLAAATTNFANR